LSHFVAVEIVPETLEVREFGCDTVDLYALQYRDTIQGQVMYFRPMVL